MMVQSHLLAAVLLGLLASRARRFTRRDWLLALGFSVVMDLDHLLQLPAYVAAHGLDALRPGEILRWGAAWQGFMHTPWGLLLVVPATFLFRSWIPGAFWLLHQFQDFVVARHLVHFMSPLELAIDLALLAAVGALLWLDHRAHPTHRPTFAAHVASVFGLAK